MPVCHLIFEDEQDSWACTCCGKIAKGNVAIVQDSVDHHASILCDICAENIGPRKVAGVTTFTDDKNTVCPWAIGSECENVNIKCHECTRDPMIVHRKDWMKS